MLEDEGFTNILKSGFANNMQHKAVADPSQHPSSRSVPCPTSRIKDITSTAGSLPNIGVSNFIPINKAGQRLDPLLSPSSHDFLPYKSAFLTHSRPCNSHHLTTAGCSLRECQFSHERLSDGAMLVLRFVIRKTPCDAEGASRKQDCYNGHICQRRECLRGDASGCKMLRVYGRDPNTVAWVKPAGAT